MGRGLFAGLFWGLLTSLVMLAGASLLAPPPPQRVPPAVAPDAEGAGPVPGAAGQDAAGSAQEEAPSVASRPADAPDSGEARLRDSSEERDGAAEPQQETVPPSPLPAAPEAERSAAVEDGAALQPELEVGPAPSPLAQELGEDVPGAPEGPAVEPLPDVELPSGPAAPEVERAVTAGSPPEAASPSAAAQDEGAVEGGGAETDEAAEGVAAEGAAVAPDAVPMATTEGAAESGAETAAADAAPVVVAEAAAPEEPLAPAADRAPDAAGESALADRPDAPQGSGPPVAPSQPQEADSAPGQFAAVLDAPRPEADVLSVAPQEPLADGPAVAPYGADGSPQPVAPDRPNGATADETATAAGTPGPISGGDEADQPQPPSQDPGPTLTAAEPPRPTTSPAGVAAAEPEAPARAGAAPAMPDREEPASLARATFPEGDPAVASAGDAAPPEAADGPAPPRTDAPDPLAGPAGAPSRVTAHEGGGVPPPPEADVAAPEPVNGATPDPAAAPAPLASAIPDEPAEALTGPAGSAPATEAASEPTSPEEDGPPRIGPAQEEARALAPLGLLPPAQPEAAAEPMTPPPQPESQPPVPSEEARGAGLPAVGLDRGVPGVRQNRLPAIGVGQEEPEAEAGVAEALDETLPAVLRHAIAFENPNDLPLFAIVLIDDGSNPADREALAALPYPVTFAVDPALPDAADVASLYRAGGKEVVMLGRDLAAGADPAEAVRRLTNAVPRAVALVDMPSGGFQGDRGLAQRVAEALAQDGYGLLTYDRGLNPAAQVAAAAGVPAATVYRVLDDEDENGPTVRRYMDRAVFHAAQTGAAVVLGRVRPETLQGVLDWRAEGRTDPIVIAPLSAVLMRNG